MLSECRDAIQAVREELKSDQVGLSAETLFGLCVVFPEQGLSAAVVFRCDNCLTNNKSLLWAPPG